MDESLPPPAPWLLDAHVHVHPGADPERLLSAAAANFGSAAATLGLTAPTAALLLAETRGAGFFHRCRRGAEGGGPAGLWSFHPTGEEETLEARAPGRPPLLLVAGRQLVTAEGLEVLALTRDLELPDGEALDATLEEVRRVGALPVLPWGFGKWTGRRGTLVDDALEREEPAELFVGDNGGRPEILGRPRRLTRAQRRGFRVLPGSDPLPLPGREVRAGSFGLHLEAAGPRETPAATLRSRLLDPAVRLVPFGRGEGLARFLWDQIRMQLRKRRRGSREGRGAP